MREHVIINQDRTVIVPESEKKIGIQYDHNVNTISFDCPRYPDEDPTIDMSTMSIYINYMLADKTLGSSLAINVAVDEMDPNIIHFDWKITHAITSIKGLLSTLICIKQVDADGNEIYHWNTDLFQKFFVGEGMECLEPLVDMNPDVITQLLLRMDDVDERTSETVLRRLISDYMIEHPLISNNGINMASPNGTNYILNVDNDGKLTTELNESGTIIPVHAINVMKIWEIENTGEPIYSSPIVKNDKVIYQSWDWYGYVRNLSDGSLDFRRPFSDVMYGAAVCEDINNDGYLEYIFASHAGEIRCYSHDNELLWSQTDEYTRSTGTCTCVGEDGNKYVLQDYSREYPIDSGFGTRNTGNIDPDNNATVLVNGVSFNIIAIANNQIIIDKSSELVRGNQYEYSIIPKYNSDKIFQHAGTLNKENDKWYLYTTGMDFCLRKIDCLTGDILWVHPSNEASEPYPFIADLGNGINVFFVSVDWRVYCLDLDGNLLWKCKLNGGIDSFTTMITLSSGEKNLIVSCRDGCVYRISKDGTIETKSVNTQADIDCSPVVYDFDGDGKQEIICGGDSGFIYCFDENLKTLWRTTIGTYLNSSGVMADVNYDGKMEVLWGDMGGIISVLDPTNGKILHQIYESGSVEGTPAIGDFDGDGSIEMIVTACDGTIKMYRFIKVEE